MAATTSTDPCPCGTGLDYGACCRPRHLGLRPAETAEALMRSRYAAFVRGELAYLVQTRDPAKRSPGDLASLEASRHQTRWTGLAVLDTAAGGASDDVGEVEFVAFFEQGSGGRSGGRGQRHERSLFRRLAGRWFYVDGEPAPRRRPPSRSESCWCGSGRKYRRCHG